MLNIILISLLLQGTIYKPGQIFTIGNSLPGTCQASDIYILTSGLIGLYVCTTTNTWTTTNPTPVIPAGSILLISTSSCPSGYTEFINLNGKTLLGTLAANGDVGTTGGNDNITPTGTNSALTFTGSSANTSLVSAGTPSGTNSTSTVTPLGTINTPTLSWPVNVPSFSGNVLAVHAHELPWQIPSTTTIRQIAIATFGTGTSRAATAVSAAGTANTTSAAVALSQSVTAGTPSGTIAWPANAPTSNSLVFTGSSSTVAAQTFTGSILGTHQHTLTATGTINTPIFTGSSFDNRSAFMKVIFCRKD